ncbi:MULTISPECIES: fumarylacetoacetase [Streptomyces]|uniref:fumarylacetoacetase n=2 Tax=Streptomyces rimosus subsp. rimosus TaxID=132474 RepID=L8ERW4_STRR1|nr:MULTISPECIES: fumarylacetoacetase [Streptomyces]KOG68339.1 fumarylacetoacetase [Kitasatospora aureofaciens]MYT44488.1 fumarylacetoacetase [Streptomyces sp. SID5471]KEF02557.1 fumarylacetoacetase [Streptomyces rimosus]KEF18637.1 fumarylacetoacetase [Streptomyces rimosus]KOT26453.1 fumarylacetoacetase [Streptomyces rimosus subsp. rimosus]
MPEQHPLDLPEDHPFGPHTLPYGVFGTADEPERRRIGVRYGDHVLDLNALAATSGSPHADLLAAPTLNPLLAAGREIWQAVREAVRTAVTDPAHRSTTESLLIPLAEVTLHLPFEVADYVDFYASEHHATNVGRIFRPNADALTPNWKHLPIGYHGRSGTVVVSGTPVVRPSGQRKAPADAAPVFGPSTRLDIEAEIGFVVGTPSALGEPVGLDGFREHVFGVCLVNDWSARDIQAWEYVPLGPFLGKSFATSVSAWITPLDALDHARTAPPARDVPPLPYLDDSGTEPGGIDLRIQVDINGETVARPPFSAMYWTAAQQLAHMTVNGASLRTGDLYASGTVSGPEPDQLGCLLELTQGKGPFLEDGDEVTLTAWAPGPEGSRIGLGEVTGRIRPARTS